MSAKEKRILQTISEAIKLMDEPEKDRLLAWGEGVVFKAQQQRSIQQTN